VASIITVQGNYLILSTDYTVLCNNPGLGTTKTMTLPSAAANTGRIFVIKRLSNGTRKCDVSGLDLSDGGATLTLSAPSLTNNAIMVQSDGSTWWIIGNNP
jgi:hypothetical protein